MAADDFHGLRSMRRRGFIVLALALMKGELSREQQRRVIMSMFGLWVLMGIGFIASTMHLGSPMRAFNSLNRVGASSLSNEIASGALSSPSAGLAGCWRW